ncbi:hypothetical protein BJ742DRAFT_893965 [Cladochytrium replicatum]|nr:hypothetical protein BJ742DRAFT_893965 [Cladochytrium replicatum]
MRESKLRFENFRPKQNSHPALGKTGVMLELAPGVMGTEKGHLLPYTAFQIGFGEVYDPNVFNSVGPMAVTKAYKRLQATSGGASALSLGLQNQCGSVYTCRRSRSTTSENHWQIGFAPSFGSPNKELGDRPHQHLMAAFKKLSVVQADITVDAFYNLVAPKYVGFRFGVAHIDNKRIVTGAFNSVDASKAKLNVEIRTKFGKLRVGGDVINLWSETLKFVFDSPRHANSVLSKVMHMPRQGTQCEKDKIELRFSAGEKIQIRRVAVYNVVTCSSPSKHPK